MKKTSTNTTKGTKAKVFADPNVVKVTFASLAREIFNKVCEYDKEDNLKKPDIDDYDITNVAEAERFKADCEEYAERKRSGKTRNFYSNEDLKVFENSIADLRASAKTTISKETLDQIVAKSKHYEIIVRNRTILNKLCLAISYSIFTKYDGYLWNFVNYSTDETIELGKDFIDTLAITVLEEFEEWCEVYSTTVKQFDNCVDRIVGKIMLALAQSK